MAENQVIILVPGRIRKEEGIILEAHSSVSLVGCGGLNILVDSGSPEHRERLISALERNHLSTSDIDVVVSTHLHGDHTANNDLFTDARKLARAEEIPPREYEAVLEDEELCDGVTLVHVPGHTRGSMAVFVEGERRYVIAGDALPTRDNYLKWVPPGLNYDPETALRSMKRIIDFAEVVVPGHGPAFEVDR